jgi:predicted lipoprotein with Yx(FWY)xxD motif
MRRLLTVVLFTMVFALPLATFQAAAQEEASLKVKKDAAHGAILTDAEGKSVYLFTPDTTSGESACYDQCAENWPPVAPSDELKLPEGVPGTLGTIERTDGGQQVTYNDIPLYFYAADSAAGDVNGQGVGGVWFVVHPGAELGPYPAAPGEGTPVPASALEIGFTEDLGPFLTDAEGRTVYLFTEDTVAGESACSDDCAVNWPPVPATDATLLPPGIQGALGSLTREDGSMQLTYNDIPLYHYVKDTATGDVTGQDVGDVWYIVPPGMSLGDEPHEGAEHEAEAEATPISS